MSLPAIDTASRGISFPRLPPVRTSLIRGGVLAAVLLAYPMRHLSFTRDLVVADPAVSGVLPRAVILPAELVFPVLLLLLSPSVRLTRSPRWVVPVLAVMVSVFVLSALAEVARGGSSLGLQVLAALRTHFRWAGPFLAGLLLLNDDDVRWLIRLCLAGAVAGSLLAVAQFSRVAGLPYSGDYVTGLMGGAGGGFLMMFNVAVFLFLEVRYLRGRLGLGRLLALGALLLLPPVLADVVFGFILFPIVVTLTYWIAHERGRGRRLVAALATSAVLFAFSMPLYSRATGFELSQRFNLAQIEAVTVGELVKTTSSTQAGRIRIMEMITDAIRATPGQLVLGLGPGTGSQSTLAGAGSFVAQFAANIEGVFMQAGFVLVETGYAGVACWVVLVALVLKATKRARRLAEMSGAAESDDNLTGVQVMVLTLILCTPYNAAFLATALMYPAWLLIGWACASSLGRHSVARTANVPTRSPCSGNEHEQPI